MENKFSGCPGSQQNSDLEKVKVEKSTLISASQSQRARGQSRPRMFSRSLDSTLSTTSRRISVSDHGNPRTLAFRQNDGENEWTPNPVLKVKTSCNYYIILCSEWRIAHCSFLCLVKALSQLWSAKVTSKQLSVVKTRHFNHTWAGAVRLMTSPNGGNAGLTALVQYRVYLP